MCYSIPSSGMITLNKFYYEDRSPKPHDESSNPSAPARYENPVLSGNAEVQAFLYLNN